jgi:ABC-2 type transport system permease protein
MRPIVAVAVRLLAFIGKELTETIRRPGALVSLVLGPFLIMAVFGLGYSGARRPLDTIVVAQPSPDLPADIAAYQRLAGDGLRIDELSTDRAAAQARLVSSDVDVVVVVPDDAQSTFQAGQQSVIEILVNTVDPVAATYANLMAAELANQVNRAIIERAAAASQGYALAAGAGADIERIPPAVVAAPTRAQLLNVAPSDPGVTSYFGPAVLALILQHLAVTLIALSLVRERMTGIMELFRIAPVSTTELLTGKLLAFGIIGAGVAAATLVLLVAAFSVPILAPLGLIAATIALLLVASLGLGLLVAVVSDSERQAVQLSLLVLLASVFFSGFVLAVDEFSEPARAIAYALPVTHGIRLLQDLMLRGAVTTPWQVLALVAIALVTLTAAWALLRRSMTRS